MPTTYPLFPITVAFENLISIEPDIIKSQFGIGGVVKGELKGINPDRQKWALNINTTKYEEVKSFLVTNRNKPFRLSLDGGITDDGKLYKMNSYTWTYISPDLQGISGELEQVRRFK